MASRRAKVVSHTHSFPCGPVQLRTFVAHKRSFGSLSGQLPSGEITLWRTWMALNQGQAGKVKSPTSQASVTHPSLRPFSQGPCQHEPAAGPELLTRKASEFRKSIDNKIDDFVRNPPCTSSSRTRFQGFEEAGRQKKRRVQWRYSLKASWSFPKAPWVHVSLSRTPQGSSQTFCFVLGMRVSPASDTASGAAGLKRRQLRSVGCCIGATIWEPALSIQVPPGVLRSLPLSTHSFRQAMVLLPPADVSGLLKQPWLFLSHLGETASSGPCDWAREGVHSLLQRQLAACNRNREQAASVILEKGRAMQSALQGCLCQPGQISALKVHADKWRKHVLGKLSIIAAHAGTRNGRAHRPLGNETSSSRLAAKCAHLVRQLQLQAHTTASLATLGLRLLTSLSPVVDLRGVADHVSAAIQATTQQLDKTQDASRILLASSLAAANFMALSWVRVQKALSESPVVGISSSAKALLQRKPRTRTTAHRGSASPLLHTSAQSSSGRAPGLGPALEELLHRALEVRHGQKKLLQKLLNRHREEGSSLTAMREGRATKGGVLQSRSKAEPLSLPPSSPALPQFALPVEGGWLSSNYGWRGGRFHQGVDIAVEENTAVNAAAAGTVAFVGWRGGYGKLVQLDHGDGCMTLYAHCNRLLVRKGQAVKRMQKIALSGNTGRSTGPHLHFEIQTLGGTLDPLTLLPKIEAEPLYKC